MSLLRLRPQNLSQRWPSIWDEDFFNLADAGQTNLEVYEDIDNVVVQANVAGLAKSEIDLTFEEGVLWIRGEKSHEQEDKDKDYYSRSSWNYSYKVSIPGNLDTSAEPEANLKDGILTVTFKKAESSKPRKLKIK